MDKRIILNVLFAIAVFFTLMSFGGALANTVAFHIENPIGSGGFTGDYISHVRILFIATTIALAVIIGSIGWLVFGKNNRVSENALMVISCFGLLALLVLMPFANNDIYTRASGDYGSTRTNVMDFTLFQGILSGLIGSFISATIMWGCAIAYTLKKSPEKNVDETNIEA